MCLLEIFGLSKNFSDIAYYLVESSIQFENPFSFFKNTNFIQNNEKNPYEEIYNAFLSIFDYVHISSSDIKRYKSTTLDITATFEYLNGFNQKILSINKKIDDTKIKISELKKVLKTLEPIIASDINIGKLVRMKFLKFRFGRLPLDSYAKKMDFLEDLPTYFVVISKDKNYVWGFYFVYHENYKRIDNIFASIYFERIRIPGENTDGTPAEVSSRVSRQFSELKSIRTALEFELENTIKHEKITLFEKFSEVKYYYQLYDLRSHVAYSDKGFYLIGWMPKIDTQAFIKLTKNDPRVTVFVTDAKNVKTLKTAPTKLKNIRLFKPFEEFVKMYGLPSYDEIDPTPFLSIAYILFFGMMFGDIGHGLCLLLFGILMNIYGKLGSLSKILTLVGASSIFFGFMYGTCFGFEGEHSIIKPIWFTPMQNSSTINRILLSTVVIGTGTIVLCMLFNITNGVKQKNYQKLFFSQNGMAGLIFYFTILYSIFSKIKFGTVNLKIITLVLLICLGIMFFQEPLSHFLNKNQEHKKWSIVESCFEMFEVLLGFVTNTVSFVRIGAFALNHAGMMSVVLMFMEKLHGASAFGIAIFGNIFVIGFEGLIVGIQTLRLGYYEMFSRFYDGKGTEFKPICETT